MAWRWQWRMTTSPKPLDNEARVLLFRAVRELLFNVLKHSQASGARVCMRRAGEHLEVIVEDNGVGFAPDKLGGFVRQNRRFRSLQHPGAPELFRRPYGDRVNPRGGHPGHSELTVAARQEKEAQPHGDPNPRQGSPPACGFKGGTPGAGKTPAALLGRSQLAFPGWGLCRPRPTV